MPTMGWDLEMFYQLAKYVFCSSLFSLSVLHVFISIILLKLFQDKIKPYTNAVTQLIPKI